MKITRLRIPSKLLLQDLIGAAFLWVFALNLPAQDPVAVYPAAGNLRAEAGTLEMWFRLEAEPDGSQKNTCHYFALVFFQEEGAKTARLKLAYQTIWGPGQFHFFFSSVGKAMGKPFQNQYVATVEETQPGAQPQPSKADRPGNTYPRTPRLKQGEWHFLALTWRGLPESKVGLWLDGREVIRPTDPLPGALWDDLDITSICLMQTPNHDNFSIDELRISDTVRSASEIADAFARGAFKRDKNTLLLDHFDAVAEDVDAVGAESKRTTAEQISGYHGEKGALLRGECYDLIEGRFGKALQLLAAPKKP